MSNIAVVCLSPSIREHVESALSKNYSLTYFDSLDKVKVSGDSVRLILLHLDSFSSDRSELVEQISSQNPKAKIFALSNFPNHQEAVVLLSKGVVGYANSRMLAQNLEHALSAVEFGDIWLPPEFITELIKAVKPNGATSEIKRRLSKKEFEVAQLVSDGHTNIEIADTLNIAERTVKSHLTSIFEKLQVKDRLALALLVKNI